MLSVFAAMCLGGLEEKATASCTLKQINQYIQSCKKECKVMNVTQKEHLSEKQKNCLIKCLRKNGKKACKGTSK